MSGLLDCACATRVCGGRTRLVGASSYQAVSHVIASSRDQNILAETSQLSSTNAAHVLDNPNSRSRDTTIATFATPNLSRRSAHNCAMPLMSSTVRGAELRSVWSCRTGVPGFHSSCANMTSNNSLNVPSSASPEVFPSKNPPRYLRSNSRLHLLPNGVPEAGNRLRAGAQ